MLLGYAIWVAPDGNWTHNPGFHDQCSTLWATESTDSSTSTLHIWHCSHDLHAQFPGPIMSLSNDLKYLIIFWFLKQKLSTFWPNKQFFKLRRLSIDYRYFMYFISSVELFQTHMELKYTFNIRNCTLTALIYKSTLLFINIFVALLLI